MIGFAFARSNGWPCLYIVCHPYVPAASHDTIVASIRSRSPICIYLPCLMDMIVQEVALNSARVCGLYVSHVCKHDIASQVIKKRLAAQHDQHVPWWLPAQQIPLVQLGTLLNEDINVWPL